MSGMKQLVINTQERAISVDINRAQLFKSQDVSELLRYWLDAVGSDDDTNGQITEPNTVETPLRAEIVNGLMVQPAVGTQDVTVTPGVAMLMAPDGTADESNYKYVRDAGIPSPGTLTIAANSSGSTRIDVVECQINAVDLIATDNRDIFNPITGLFTAAVITKERSARLTYRVRQGTPGAGMPSNQLGWLPLCVANVPNGSANNDGVTFWDVRPLVSDRQFGAYNQGASLQDLCFDGHVVYNGTGPVSTLTGLVKASFGGRRVGGIVRRGSPGTDGNSLVLTDAANQDPGFSLAADNYACVYLAFPFSLPRWARYTDSGSGSRKPRAPRGIPIVSNTLPSQDSTPSSALSLPTSTGLGGTTSSAVCVLETLNRKQDGTNRAPQETFIYGRRKIFGQADTGLSLVDAGSTATRLIWTLTAGTHYPKNARALLISIQFTANNGPSTTYLHLNVYRAAFGVSTDPHALIAYVTPLDVPGAGGLNFTVPPLEIPVPFLYPGTPPVSFSVTLDGPGTINFNNPGGNPLAISGFRT